MSATDRELLELAARAAGIKGRYFWNIDDAGVEMDGGIVWNPLYDDGAALRLAVKLRLSIIQEEEHFQGKTVPTVEVMSEECKDGSRICCMQSLDDDAAAATRRAIVRTAAAIAAAQQTQGGE